MAAFTGLDWGGTGMGITYGGESKEIVASTLPKGVPKAMKEPPKKLSPEEEALEIMAKAREERVKQVKENLEVKIRDYRDQLKTIAVLKKTKKSLLDEYLTLVKENKGKLVDEYRKVITQLKSSELITAVDVDSENRLIFTTAPVIVKKEKWKHGRLAGVYQIRVDFSETNGNSAIRLLNITQRQGGHDHPHVSETVPCFGNVRADIEQDLKDKNIYELIVDVTDYLKSDADSDGYLQYDGNDEELNKKFSKDEKDNEYGAWEQFLSKAEKMPEGFCFAMYEQQKKEKTKTSPVVTDQAGGGTIQYSQINSGQISTAVSSSAYPQTLSFTADPLLTGSNWAYMNETTLPYSPYRDKRRVSYYQAEMAQILEELGLTEKAAWHFVDYIEPTKDMFITQVELVDRHDSVWLMVHATAPVSPMRFTESVLPEPMAMRNIQRIFLNWDDIDSEEWPNLKEHGRKTAMVSFRTNERYLHEKEQEEVHERKKIEYAAFLQTQMMPSPRDHTRAVEIRSEEDLSNWSVKKLPEKEEKPSRKATSPTGEIAAYGLVTKPKKKLKKEAKSKSLTFGAMKETIASLLEPSIKDKKKYEEEMTRAANEAAKNFSI